MKDLYAESYKTLLKEIKDLNKWKDICAHGSENLILLRYQYDWKAIYKFNTSPIKIPVVLFAEKKISILKFMWHLKGPHIVQTILKKLNKVGGPTLGDFKAYFKAIVIKTGWYWHKDRLVDQWKRIESPPDKPSSVWSNGLPHRSKTIWWGKASLFN